MGLCSSKNTIAPQKPLKTLEQLEEENGGKTKVYILKNSFYHFWLGEARPTAFVIPADDSMVVSTKKPNDLEAEKEVITILLRQILILTLFLETGQGEISANQVTTKDC